MQTTLTSELVAAKNSKKFLVVLHGRGDSLDGFRWLPEALGLEINYLLVNAPDPYYTGYSWYGLPPNQKPGVDRSRLLLEQLFCELETQGVASSDVALLGFSQGCLMALEWGARTPKQLAGFVGISGYCLDPDAIIAEQSPASQQTRWLITHGHQDSVLDFTRTEQQMLTLKNAGWPLEFKGFAKDHTIDDQSELPLLRAFIKSTLSL
jgi:phospholipase/carboxylesterase